MNKSQEVLASKMRKGIVRILKYRICLVACSYLSKDKVISYEIVLLILRNNMVLGEKTPAPKKPNSKRYQCYVADLNCKEFLKHS